MEKRFIDTHTHLYLSAFKNDISEVIARAIGKGVYRMFLPNLDSSTIQDMLSLCDLHPGTLFPMIGLHPTSVKDNYLEELDRIEGYLHDSRFIAIGETGIDLYWDKTFIKEQQDAFRKQLRWAKTLNLPVVIHARESFNEIFHIMDEENSDELHGVFHSFTGTIAQVEKIQTYNFYIGINGISTFKNADLSDTITSIPLDKLLIETDAPFLAPVPYRGKRNESSYVTHVAERVAQLFNKDIDEIASRTTTNALSLFKKAI
ncbi:TatD family hydrolase [Bacteroidota bacterium]